MMRKIRQIALGALPVSLLRNRQARTARRADSSGHKQLLVDVSAIAKADAGTGIQRVVRNLYRQLLLTPPAGYQVCPVMATRKNFYRHVPGDFLQPGFTSSASGTPIQVAEGDIFLGLDLSAHLIPHHLSEMREWKNQGVRMSFFIYDLLPVLQPQWFNPKATQNFHRWLRAVAMLADDAIAISRTVQEDFGAWMQKHYGLSHADLPCATIPLGAELDQHGQPAELPPQIRSPFILMVGTIEPRKGYDEALDAFGQLWNTDNQTQLVIVGKQGWKVEALVQRLQVHPESGKRLIWLNQVDDSLLHDLYRHSLGILMASRGEGYGLPLIEAMHYNKPVLARDISVFRDVAGASISYFDGHTQTRLERVLPLWLLKINQSGGVAYPIPSTWQQACTALLQALAVNVSDVHVSSVYRRTVLQKASLRSSSQGGA